MKKHTFNIINNQLIVTGDFTGDEKEQIKTRLLKNRVVCKQLGILPENTKKRQQTKTPVVPSINKNKRKKSCIKCLKENNPEISDREIKMRIKPCCITCWKTEQTIKYDSKCPLSKWHV